ncbi:MAG: hypothetical protein QNJ54_37930 [Prochloraceae cyanobacterium]|nr:hypothetical protein [Prochloraceae cyanobacterium]
MTGNTGDRKNRSDITTQIWASVIFFLIIFLLYVILKFYPGLTGAITAKDSVVTELGNVIVVFSFISLALQSSLGVFVSNWRRQNKIDFQRQITILKTDLDELKTQLEPIKVSLTEASQTTVDLSKAELTKLREQLAQTKVELKNAENNLDLYTEQTRNIISRLSLLAGIIISLAGVRILQPFTNVTLEGEQLTLFNAIDILLTGGLLAGGTEGVHRLTKVYESITDLSKTVGKK